MAKKQKLELTWVGKNEKVKLEPRVLVEDDEKKWEYKLVPETAIVSTSDLNFILGHGINI